jgi:CelD/BcsL family acetyltransferase involved in cellulose biosynthesis
MALPSAPASPRSAASADGWRFSLSPVGDDAALAHAWRGLQTAGDTPFFLSWDWIGCWLKSLPAESQPALLRIERDARLIGLAIVTRANRRRCGLFPYRSSSLHEAGESGLDSLTIEYNGILAAPPLRDEALLRATDWLLATHTDELHLSGIAASTLDRFNADLSLRLRARKPTYVVDLAHLRASGRDVAATLSANSRAQLRRALRQFNALGPLQIARAGSRDEAQDMLARMIPLHQTYWRARGQPGAFSDARIVAFHRRLIDDSFAEGCIQLLRCGAGDSLIGYLYNFTRDGRVYSYQSGIDYDLLPRGKAGWVCHALAIDENVRLGMTAYDLLAGESRFKASLGARGPDLAWVTVERKSLGVTLRKLLRSAKAMVRKPRLA